MRIKLGGGRSVVIGQGEALPEWACDAWLRHNPASSDEDLAKKRRSQRNSILRRKYGMTIEEYEEMAARQGNRCAICGRESVDRVLAVDHDHETGRVRGLLCAQCNVLLGQYESQPEVLRGFTERADQYLAA